MEDIEVPTEIDSRDAGIPGVLALGPFVVEHGERLSVGGFLEDKVSEYAVWNGERTLSMDETYDVSVDGDRISFDSQRWGSHIAIRPLRESDMSWCDPRGDYGTFDKMFADQARILANDTGG